jgi:hypothetical protein
MYSQNYRCKKGIVATANLITCNYLILGQCLQTHFPLSLIFCATVLSLSSALSLTLLQSVL